MVKNIKSNLPGTKTSKQVSVTSASFSGPIPPPEALKGYDAIMPGLAERIVSMAESEIKHRHKIESETLRINEAAITAVSADIKRGQGLAFSVVLISFAVCIASIFMGAPDVAKVVGGTTVVSLAVAFVAGRLIKNPS